MTLSYYELLNINSAIIGLLFLLPIVYYGYHYINRHSNETLRDRCIRINGGVKEMEDDFNSMQEGEQKEQYREILQIGVPEDELIKFPIIKESLKDIILNAKATIPLALTFVSTIAIDIFIGIENVQSWAIWILRGISFILVCLLLIEFMYKIMKPYQNPIEKNK